MEVIQLATSGAAKVMHMDEDTTVRLMGASLLASAFLAEI
jgi:hypothetical protein